MPRGRRGPNLHLDAEGRFWRGVDRTTLLGCWEWQLTRTPEGYGVLFDGIRLVLAHRFSWELHNGKMGEGMVCRHDCDNRSCVNPAHLRIGSHADNVADKVARGRQAKGEGNGRAVLNVEDVREIRRAYEAGESIGDITRRYPVARRTISYIVQRINWKHVA